MGKGVALLEFGVERQFMYGYPHDKRWRQEGLYHYTNLKSHANISNRTSLRVLTSERINMQDL
jgi:hypothetical protein